MSGVPELWGISDHSSKLKIDTENHLLPPVDRPNNNSNATFAETHLDQEALENRSEKGNMEDAFVKLKTALRNHLDYIDGSPTFCHQGILHSAPNP